MSDIHEKRESYRIFDTIAGSYDLVNKIISLGLHRYWRSQVRKVLPAGDTLKVLDLATGTADMPLALMRSRQVGTVHGLDLSVKMLDIARRKIRQADYADRIFLALGDAQKIPYDDGSFNAVTMVFGIRNVFNVNRCLTECLRVLAPGGRVLILEFAVPQGFIMQLLFAIYMNCFVRPVGWLVGNGAAYRYLDRTIKDFPFGGTFVAMLHKAGFVNSTFKMYTFGIVNLYWGEKPL